MYNLENDIAWTTELKNAFKHNITRARIIYEGNVITEDTNIISVEIEDNRYVPNIGFIGQATSKMATITLKDLTNTINLENKEFQLAIGADYERMTYYINYGNFIVNELPQVDETNGQIKIVAFDYMLKFNLPYEDQVTYPCTMKQLLENVCEQAGVELGTEHFANENFEVENNQFEGKTLREVLQNIANSAFSWARIGQDNKLYLDFEVKDISLQNNITETITIDEYEQDGFKKANEYYGPVNRVVYGQSNISGQEEYVEDIQSIETNGISQIVINDNYFAYTTQKRNELVQAGTRLFGLKYMPVQELKLIGLAYLDCRDIVKIETTDLNSYYIIPFNHKIKYNGVLYDSVSSENSSINEQVYENKNSNAKSNAQLEIIVDRALKQIQSVAKDVYEQDGSVNEKFTQIYQDIANIINTVQNAGGSNLIKNSVMFAYDTEGNPLEWELSETGNITIASSAESLQAGGISGHVFILNNETVSQRIPVVADNENIEDKTYYTFSCRASKNTTGTAYIKVYNDLEEYRIDLANGEKYYYEQFELRALLPKSNYYIIELYGSEGSGATFTDLMLNIGEYKTQWQQANGEIMNTQVNISVDGVLVKSTVYEGDYTVMSPLEFAGYSNINGRITKVFSLNKDTTEVEKLKVDNGIVMPPIKIVPITTGSKQGWAFVPYTEGV